MIEALPAAAFSSVMATGIVSIAMSQASQHQIADALAWLALVLLCSLGIAHAARLVMHPPTLSAELRHPMTAFDGLTLVAAVGVVGATFAPVQPARALLFFLVALAFWVVLACMALRSLLLHRAHGFAAHASGRWLLFVVALQALSTLAVLSAPSAPAGLLRAVALAAWIAGLAAYPVIAAAIVVRLHHQRWTPHALTPDHWVLMGALAISALTATNLTTVWSRALHDPLVAASVVLWSVASVLYPLLAVTTIQRLLTIEAVRRYDVRWWACVFPLGMYASCTFALEGVLHTGALKTVAHITAWVAFGVWAAVSVTAIRRLLIHARGWTSCAPVPEHP